MAKRERSPNEQEQVVIKRVRFEQGKIVIICFHSLSMCNMRWKLPTVRIELGPAA